MIYLSIYWLISGLVVLRTRDEKDDVHIICSFVFGGLLLPILLIERILR